MRIRAILLCTVALWPMQAQADPLTAAFTAVVASVGSATAGTGLLGAAAGWYGSLGAIGQFAIRTAVGVGLAAVSQALLNPVVPAPAPSDMTDNYQQPIAYQERCYGEVRKGGPYGFTGRVNDARHIVILIAAHEIDGYVTHLLDDIEVEICDTAGVPSGANVGDVISVPMARYEDGIFAKSKGNLRFYTGTSAQAADSILISAFPGQLSTSYDFTGLAYGVIRATEPDPESALKRYPTGKVWKYAPIIRGNNQIYDPRTDSFGYSDNWALCFAHELTHYWGRTVDWSLVAIEADACDELLTNAEGGLVKRWPVGLTILDSASFDEIRAQFLAAADAFYYELPDGSVGFYCGRWIEPQVDLIDTDFLSFTLSETVPFGAANEFVVTYPEPLNLYRETPTGAYVFDPAEQLARDEMQVNGCVSHNQGSRLNKRRARHARARYKLSGTIKAGGIQLVGERFFRFASDIHGLDLTWEIDGLSVSETRGTYDIEASSVTAEDFAFDAEMEEPARPTYERIVDDDAVPVVTGLALSNIDMRGAAARIALTWDEQSDSYTQRARIRISGATEWAEIDFAGSGNTYNEIGGLRDNQVYEVQIRNVSKKFGLSDWSPVTPATIETRSNQTAPVALVSFAATGEAGQTVLDFTPPNDPRYAATRIYRAAGPGGSLGSASLVQTFYGPPSVADSGIDTVGAGDYTYWGIPINSSNVEGPVSGPIDVTVG